jgi:hypothetical protein
VTSPSPPPPTVTTGTNTATQSSVAPTTTVVLVSAGDKVSVPRRTHSGLFFGLMILMSIFTAQIQATPMSGATVGHFTGSIMVFPLIWLLFSSRVYGLCETDGYINVNSVDVFLLI